MNVRLSGSQGEVAQTQLVEGAIHLGQAVAVFVLIALAHSAAGSVDLDCLSGLGVFQGNPADRWQGMLALVGEEKSGQIVTAVSARKGAKYGVTSRLIGVGEAAIRTLQEVREKKDHRLAFQEPVHVIEGIGEVRALAFGFVEEDLADDPEYVRAAFARWHIRLDPVGEKEESYLVVVLGGGKGEDAGELGGQLPFRLGSGAKSTGSREVDEKHEGELAFLAVDFDKGPIHARGDVPVDGADLVARLVLADLLKVHSLAFENTMVSPRQGFGHHPVGTDLQSPHLPENIPGLLFLLGHGAISGDGDCVENAGDDRFARVALSLCFVGRDHSMAEHIHTDRLDVMRGDVTTPLQEGPGFGSKDE